jgi:hypothetical protein
MAKRRNKQRMTRAQTRQTLDVSGREALAKRVVAVFAVTFMRLADAKDDIDQLWRAFATLKPGEKIMGCESKTEFCDNVLKRNIRSIQYLLNGRTKTLPGKADETRHANNVRVDASEQEQSEPAAQPGTNNVRVKSEPMTIEGTVASSYLCEPTTGLPYLLFDPDMPGHTLTDAFEVDGVTIRTYPDGARFAVPPLEVRKLGKNRCITNDKLVRPDAAKFMAPKFGVTTEQAKPIEQTGNKKSRNAADVLTLKDGMTIRVGKNKYEITSACPEEEMQKVKGKSEWAGEFRYTMLVKLIEPVKKVA